ncbi:RagB/SusD family nutrient uptake outer membrane protein [Marinilabiliaceae bacterium JC017]|nr:RagB/SusD family nutrient uptake outer membrane protein [Marinilabiliaceae bacterium JC017]
MRKIYWLVAILGVCLLPGCEIETAPYDALEDAQVIGTEDGLQTATLGNYSYLKKEYFVKPFHYIGEFGGDNIALSGTTSDKLMYIYNYKHTNDNYYTQRLWQYSYQDIISCNRVIDLAEKGKSPEMDQLIGENYYLRGFLYFTLCSAFGRPYNQNPTANLGVPVKLTTDIDDLPPRETVAKVYKQIEDDLLEAAKLMTIDKENIYATKEAAYALLARLYLYKEDNTRAEEYATKVIESGRFELLATEDLPKYFTKSPEENKETIFAIKHIKDKDYLYDGWYNIGAMYAQIEGQGWGEMYASSSYRELLDQYPEDVRHGFIDPQYTKDDAGNMELWALWVDEDKGLPMFDNQNIEEEAGKYVYFVDTNLDGKETKFDVEKVVADGVTKYFLDDWDRTKDDKGNDIMVNRGTREVKITNRMHDRNGYPKYYVLKCSKQDGQAHLWSPVVSRLAEMYLIRAEANAKTGNGKAALVDVNEIRQRAGLTGDALYQLGALPDGKSVLDIVLEERRLELAYEGHRRFDVFRNGRTLDRNYPGSHLAGNEPFFTVPANHPRVVDYIPREEIWAQPNLIQNP